MSTEVQVVQTKLVFPPFSKQMSQISIQISSGATVHLSWNIIGGYEKDCTIAELYNGIKSGSISIDFWSFLDKLSNHNVSVSIGRSKVDTFDIISVNTSLSVAISTFGRYIKLELHKLIFMLSFTFNTAIAWDIAPDKEE